MIVTATQIKIKGIPGFIRFVPALFRINQQLQHADGLLFIKFNGLRTLSGWESEEAMRSFRNQHAHLQGMKKLKKIGQAKSITWVTDTEPQWDEAIDKLANVSFKKR